MQKLRTVNPLQILFPTLVPKFVPNFVSNLSLFVPSAVIGDRIETKNINDSDKGLSEKHIIAAVFMQSMHHDMHKKLTTFLSMSCHCIFKNNFCIMMPHRPVHSQWSS